MMNDSKSKNMLLLLNSLMEKVLRSGESIKAHCDIANIGKYVETYFGFSVDMVELLNCNDNLVFRVKIKSERQSDNPHEPELDVENGYVLKLTNCIDSKNLRIIRVHDDIYATLAKNFNVCPVLVKQINGSTHAIENIPIDGKATLHITRLFHYIPGKTFGQVRITKNLLKNLGLYTANLHQVLLTLENHSFYLHYKPIWSLATAPKLRLVLEVLPKAQYDHDLIVKILDAFEDTVLKAEPGCLVEGVLHGNLNDDNVIVTDDAEDVKAVIDFDDTHKSYLVLDLAVILANLIVRTGNVALCKHVIEGYQVIRNLTNGEREAVKLAICSRLIQSLVLGEYIIHAEAQSKTPRRQVAYIKKVKNYRWYHVKTIWEMDEKNLMDLLGIPLIQENKTE